MLVELAAINAAMATIKTTIAHGKDIASAGTAIAKLINGEEELRERANAKQNSIFSKLLGKDTGDIDEFMALERINTQREELREMMQLYGRPGMYTDWIKYQTEARLKRKKAKEEQKQAMEKLVRNILLAILFIVIVGGLLGVSYVAWWLKGQQ